MKPVPPPPQLPPSWGLPKTNREAFTEMLQRLQRELSEAEQAMAREDSRENQDRYCTALLRLDRWCGGFPALAGGNWSGDIEV